MWFQNGDPFILGVNYWPRRKAMYWWQDFDPGEAAREFAILHELGLGWVRIFLLWEDWQPSPGEVSLDALRSLEQVCDTAASNRLKLDLTFFTGHMSGPNWVPPWMLRIDQMPAQHVRQVVSGGRVYRCGYLNPFSDPDAMEAEELLLRTVVERLGDHPAIGMWNLGNEPDLFAWPPNHVVGSQWVRRMVAVIREIDHERPITCGLHTESLFQDNGFRVNDVYREVDAAVMHGYPMYVDWARDPLDPDFVPFLCALTTALSGKATLVEEFGGCTTAPGAPSTYLEWDAYGKRHRQFMASEEDLADYLREVLPELVRVGATGAMLWCFADYAPELYHRPPCDESIHERTFGLVRPDGTLKPHAEVIREFAATNPVIQPPQQRVLLDIDADEYYQQPLQNAIQAYKKYLS